MGLALAFLHLTLSGLRALLLGRGVGAGLLLLDLQLWAVLGEELKMLLHLVLKELDLLVYLDTPSATAKQLLVRVLEGGGHAIEDAGVLFLVLGVGGDYIVLLVLSQFCIVVFVVCLVGHNEALAGVVVDGLDVGQLGEQVVDALLEDTALAAVVAAGDGHGSGLGHHDAILSEVAVLAFVCCLLGVAVGGLETHDDLLVLEDLLLETVEGDDVLVAVRDADVEGVGVRDVLVWLQQAVGSALSQVGLGAHVLVYGDVLTSVLGLGSLDGGLIGGGLALLPLVDGRGLVGLLVRLVVGREVVGETGTHLGAEVAVVLYLVAAGACRVARGSGVGLFLVALVVIVLVAEGTHMLLLLVVVGLVSQLLGLGD